MPQIQVKSKHNLSAEEATTRIKKRISEEVDKQVHYVTDVKETWSDPNHAEFSFKAYGFALSGSFASEPGEVDVSINLPFAAIMVKGMIESQLKTALEQVLQ
ncbi:MAG: polyhydroxyalkanoic acid system family protein [Thermoguttaceae bacterium]